MDEKSTALEKINDEISLETREKMNRLRSNTSFVRASIFYEYRRKTPVFDAFRAFCNGFGDDFMQYREFDFLYHRLGDGSLDLRSEAGWNPDALSFPDIPIGVIHRIIDDVPRIDRLMLRNVSRGLLDIISDRNPGFKRYGIALHKDKLVLTYGNDDVNYLKSKNDCIVSHKDRESTIDGKSYKEIALNDLSNVLKTSKISIKTFEINAYEGENKKNLKTQLSAIQKSLKTLEQLSVEYFNLYNVSCGYARSILPLLKAEKLETIHISSKCSSRNCCLDDIIEMEQWKSLKSVYFLGGCKVSAPIEKFFSLDDIFILVKSFSVNDAIKIRDELLPTPTFHFAMFRGGISNSIEIAKVFNPEYSGGVNGTFEFTANDSIYVIEICPNLLQIDKRS